MTRLARIESTIRRITAIFVSAALGWMVLLALTQLLLRWFFGYSIMWADLQLRQMVLIIALFGGVLAAVDNRHIRIDLTQHYVRGPVRHILHRLVSVFSSILMFFMALISLYFIQSEREAGLVLRGFLFGKNIPQWYLEIAIPICFGVMGLLFLFKAFQPVESTRISGQAQ